MNKNHLRLIAYLALPLNILVTTPSLGANTAAAAQSPEEKAFTQALENAPPAEQARMIRDMQNKMMANMRARNQVGRAGPADLPVPAIDTKGLNDEELAAGVVDQNGKLLSRIKMKISGNPDLNPVDYIGEIKVPEVPFKFILVGPGEGGRQFTSMYSQLITPALSKDAAVQKQPGANGGDFDPSGRPNICGVNFMRRLGLTEFNVHTDVAPIEQPVAGSTILVKLCLPKKPHPDQNMVFSGFDEKPFVTEKGNALGLKVKFTVTFKKSRDVSMMRLSLSPVPHRNGYNLMQQFSPDIIANVNAQGGFKLDHNLLSMRDVGHTISPWPSASAQSMAYLEYIDANFKPGSYTFEYIFVPNFIRKAKTKGQLCVSFNDSISGAPKPNENPEVLKLLKQNMKYYYRLGLLSVEDQPSAAQINLSQIYANVEAEGLPKCTPEEAKSLWQEWTFD